MFAGHTKINTMSMLNFKMLLHKRYITLEFNVAFPLLNVCHFKRPSRFWNWNLFCISNALHHLPTLNKQMIVSCHSPFQVFLAGKKKEKKERVKKHTNRNISILHPDSEFRSHNILYIPFLKNHIFCFSHSCLLPSFSWETPLSTDIV